MRYVEMVLTAPGVERIGQVTARGVGGEIVGEDNIAQRAGTGTTHRVQKWNDLELAETQVFKVSLIKMEINMQKHK